MTIENKHLKPSDIATDKVFFLAGIAVVLLITYLAYRPGLTGPFLLDDFSSLAALGANGGIENLESARQFVFGNTSGPTGRPVSMASFLIDGQTWPTSVGSFKHTNILIHLITGLLIGWFTLLLFLRLGMEKISAQFSALAVMAIWLLHPFNVSTTLYVVQRMTQLMAMFSMAGLICYMSGVNLIRESPAKGLILLCLCLFPFGMLAVLSKENGVLLLVAILVLEFTVIGQSKKTNLYRIWLAVGILLPLLILLTYMTFTFQSLTGDYAYRNFTLAERLLTESRIMFHYLFSIFLPIVTDFSLFHDNISISTSLLNPISTFFSLTVFVLLVVAGVYYRSRYPILSFSIFWFIGWHLLESTFLPLELYFEHRNYLPMLGPIIGLVFYCQKLLARIEKHSLIQFTRSAMVLGVIVCGLLTTQLTLLWGNTGALLSHWAEQKPDSVRAQVVYADTLAALGQPGLGFENLIAIQQRFPDEITLLLQSWNFSCTNGIEPPISIEHINQKERLEFFRDDVNYQVRVFIENMINNRCVYPAQQQVITLMDRISALPLRNWDRGNFHFLFSDVYVYYRQLTPALSELTKAFEYRPTADIPIRQAIISASAGNYTDSLNYLELARVTDSSRNSLLPSRLAEISRMEEDLRSRL